MKHGPIALLDSETPVVCIATDQKVVYEKVVSNIQEVRARGAQVIAIATDGNETSSTMPTTSSTSRARPPSCRRCSPCCRCSCWPIASPAYAG